MELLPFVDILKVFNNPINEEQAWAVCYQCVNFLFRSQKQEYYQFVYEYGIHSIWLNRQGDVLLRKMPPDGSESGKGSPHNQHSLHGSTSNTDISKRKRHLIATEMDAVQALGTAIFEALDYGIDPSEERQLSQELESLIVTMTNADNSLDYDPDAQNADDEGIEKDADVEHRCTVLDVIRLCGQHLSSKQDAQHHYKAVCRALATEAGELFTFLDKIATCKEKLSETKDEDARRLEELRRADWACLWVQVMRSLRQGVCLKKVEHVSLPPLEYELTPFEMLLEDIRSRRYTLHKIMVNGEIPHKVKDNAHAVILDFIRSRPPLKKVNDRKLKPKPPPQPDPHERLLKDIRSRPKLRPVRSGRLVVDTSGARLGGGDEPELSQPAKRVIKPDLSLLLNNSFEESSDDDDHSSGSSQMSSPVSAAHSKMSTPLSSWQRSASKDAFLQDSSSHRPTKLQRRHTIMVCDSSMDGKVAPQELPPLEEEEEPSPVRESHQFSSDSIPRQAHGSAVLSRTSFSDNDLPNQVTLRYPQGQPRRYSLEHRRSLTSMNTGLCAIPEMEDSQGGTDSPTKSSGAMLRSWSHEQAPPPNPSPPCKGRARAALGMSLAGMKSVGGPYHPGAHRPHAGVPSALTSYNPSTRHTSSGMTTDSVHTSLAAHYFQHTSVTSSKHAQPACTPSLSSSISTSSYSSSHIPSLDPTASSQSPGYRRKLVMPQGSAGQTKTSCDNSQQHEHYNDRWRRPIGRQGKLNSQQRQDATEDDVFDCVDSSLDHQQSVMLTEEARSRRLSLDSRVGLYKDRHEQLSGTAEFEDTHKPSRRLSLGTQRNIRGVDVTHRRVRTIEEEERLSRLKMLHEESLTPRTRRVGRDMNNQQLAFTTEPAKHVPQQYSQQHNIGASLPDLSNENMDIFQQISASEEARFARWRKLEETGGFTVPLEEDLKKLSPVEKEYVKDILSARLQTSAPVKSAESGSSMAPGVLPLPKRWQNPVECLGLTLEEVTHIRSVLTKAELESLISHPDLYQQVSKSKLCFTCKTTRFSLFGEWGTKCKFCKRTVCSKCLRKMNVPDDQFKHIPVYTLSPVPLTAEMQEVVHTLTKTSSTPSVQLSQGSNISRTKIDVPEQLDQRPQLAESVPSLDDDAKVMKGFFTRSKPLQRSQSLVVPGHRSSPGIPRTAKGPAMAICCDCKGMVKEIIRATQASLAVLSSPGSSATVPTSSIHPTSTFGTLTNSSV